jgi:hypothetical protein
MNENQTKLIHEAIRLIERRAVDPRRTLAQRMAYNSALTMLLYALDESAECLAQFDDVKLDCEECARFGAERMCDVEMCNLCENYSHFECRG